MPCRNLDVIFEEENFEPEFMSIDIEGMDYKILRSLKFSKYEIKIIIAEISSQINENAEMMNVLWKEQVMMCMGSTDVM